MNQFSEKRKKFALSEKLKKKYSKKLKKLEKSKDDYFIDGVLSREKNIALHRDMWFRMCPDEECSEDDEDKEILAPIPRKDRFLLLISEYFSTYIASEDKKLKKAINGSGLLSRCYSSSEASNMILTDP